MTRTCTLLGIATLALVATPVFAINLNCNADEDQSILNDHGKMGYVGTSFTMGSSSERGRGDSYGSILLDTQVSYPAPAAGMAKDWRGFYGSSQDATGF